MTFRGFRYNWLGMDKNAPQHISETKVGNEAEHGRMVADDSIVISEHTERFVSILQRCTRAGNITYTYNYAWRYYILLTPRLARTTPN